MNPEDDDSYPPGAPDGASGAGAMPAPPASPGAGDMMARLFRETLDSHARYLSAAEARATKAELERDAARTKILELTQAMQEGEGRVRAAQAEVEQKEEEAQSARNEAESIQATVQMLFSELAAAEATIAALKAENAQLKSQVQGAEGSPKKAQPAPRAAAAGAPAGAAAAAAPSSAKNSNKAASAVSGSPSAAAAVDIPPEPVPPVGLAAKGRKEGYTAEGLELQRKEERQAILKIDQTSLSSPSDYWYLVSEEWLAAWRSFVNNTPLAQPTREGGRKPPSGQEKMGVLPPGPISNHYLVGADGVALPDLRPSIHYRGLSPRVWAFLVGEYGGGPPIRRKKIDLYGHAPDGSE